MTTEQPTTTPADQQHVKLILSIAPEGSVIQFSPDCERITGYTRAEILHQAFTYLLPTDAHQEWDELFTSLKARPQHTTFTLPLQTRTHQRYDITWNALAVTDPTKGLQSVCLIGETTHPVTLSPVQPTPQPQPLSHAQPEPHPTTQPQDQPQPQPEPQQPPTQPKTTPPLTPPTAPPSAVEPQPQPAPDTTPLLISVQQDLKSLQDKITVMESLLHNLTITVTTTNTVLSMLPDQLQTLTQEVHDLTTTPQPSQPSQPIPQPQARQPDKEKHAPFQFKKKHATTKHQSSEHDQRALDLDAREAQLLAKARDLDIKLDEFCALKEKLKAVEDDIEHRRIQLDSLHECRPTPEPETRETDIQTTLSTLTDGAIVVQRGIIKHSNTPFTSLIGYDATELTEHSLFDFIALEGLGHIEQYYLDRLKGEPNQGYMTVFTTKTNTRIPVNVQIKPTRFNGEKAEILIINTTEPQEKKQ